MKKYGLWMWGLKRDKSNDMQGCKWHSRSFETIHGAIAFAKSNKIKSFSIYRNRINMLGKYVFSTEDRRN